MTRASGRIVHLIQNIYDGGKKKIGECLFFSAYRCPVCMHSVWNMEKHWEQIGQEIAQTPMPPEYKDATVKVRP